MPKNISRNKRIPALQSAGRKHSLHTQHQITNSAITRRRRTNGDSRSITPAPPPHSPTSSAAIKPKRRKSWFKRLVFFILFAILISGGIFGYKIIAAGDKISSADRSILGQLKDLLFSQGEYLSGEQDGRINILLIAIGGKGHKGENLADTIMIASINPQTNQAALLSIPRDLYVQVPGEEYYAKINSVHAYGESQKRDRGPAMLTELVQEITGLPIHYYLRVDFTAFKGIIDSVGGVNITTDNSFYDYWHKISFPAGTERMNGERALAYVRARYIEGPEGGDFKRAARQQQVILALRAKVFSIQTALDFSRVNTILNSLSDNIRTNMRLWEMKRAFELARLIDPGQVNSSVLTSGPKGVLVGGTEILGGAPASILKPRTGDFSEIRTIAQNMLDQNLIAAPPPASLAAPTDKPAPDPSPTPTPTPIPDPISIEVRNGTNIAGLAKKTADSLETDGFNITAIGNADIKSQANTIIYLINPAQKTAVEDLAKTLNINLNTEKPPDSERASNADALLILGQDLADNDSE